MAALGLQLQRLGVRQRPSLSFDDKPDVVLMGLLAELFKLMGHVISMQYGGSEAHLDVMRDGVAGSLGGLATAAGGVETWGTKLFTSIRRYYSNAFTDREKQDAFNLMLGKFAPWRDVALSRAEGGNGVTTAGRAYRHIWEWKDDESAANQRDDFPNSCSDYFLHNPAADFTKLRSVLCINVDSAIENKDFFNGK